MMAKGVGHVYVIAMERGCIIEQKLRAPGLARGGCKENREFISNRISPQYPDLRGAQWPTTFSKPIEGGRAEEPIPCAAAGKKRSVSCLKETAPGRPRCGISARSSNSGKVKTELYPSSLGYPYLVPKAALRE